MYHVKLKKLILILSLSMFGSCANVEYYDRETLSSPIMQFDADRTRNHVDEKIFQSIEGAAGGFGGSSGGGCGCS